MGGLSNEYQRIKIGRLRFPSAISLEEDMAAVITMLRLAVDRNAPLTCRELDKLADRICGWDCVLGDSGFAPDQVT
jgi:hypothetical protein